MSASKLPLRIALTAGEPAGIGPELLVQMAQHAYEQELVAIGDAKLLEARAKQLRLPLKIIDYQADQKPRASAAGCLTVLDIPLITHSECGQLNAANAAYVIATLYRAGFGCLSQEFNAVVTGPVHKSIINEAGILFRGHTEFFAELAEVKQVVMMLTTPGLRVALTTIHLPLAAVAKAITVQHLEQTLRILNHDLKKYFGLEKPRILVCGLNPHAGESGHLGREEITVITPVIQRLQAEGFDLKGPLPADTIFIPSHLSEADIILTMYHDQGLPVLKHIGFNNAINVTLGLPFVRTSVDHGTALDLAGTGKADTGSLQAAIAMAVKMVKTNVS